MTSGRETMKADSEFQSNPTEDAGSGGVLMGELLTLRKQVAQSVKLRQDVLELSHRLDQERARFNAMQNFIRHGVQVESDEELAMLVCESIIDLLDCGVGLFLCLRCNKGKDCLVQSGLGMVRPNQQRALMRWIDAWLPARSSRSGSLAPLPDILGLREEFHVELVMDSSGQPLAAIFACNTQHHPGFHEGFPHAVDTVFGTFANQVGVLIESLKRRGTISGQIERIRVSEERLSTALSASNVGLWDWDLNTDRVFYSTQWKCQLGMEDDEVGDSVGEWSGRLHPEDIEKALEIAAKCSAKPGGNFEITVRMRHRDGRWLWINTRGFNVSDQVIGIRRMIGTHLDVTAHKVLETRLLESERQQRLAREQAESANRAKSSFLAAISHEIRTPLNGMLAAFQLLGVTDGDEERRRLVALGEGAGKWMLKIIGESLDIIRIEAGKVDLNPETVDLKPLLDELEALERPKAVERGIDFQWKIAPDVPRQVHTDPVRLRQILANLVGNALKFTRSGFVLVEVRTGRPSGKGRRSIRFSVTDSGIGFSKSFGRMIFQPFSQETRKSESGEHGVGLGLVITKELVGLMGGSIKVWSEPGKGSRFIVRLPLDEPVIPVPETANEEDSIRQKFRGRVLLAEDDETSGELGRMMMEQLGLQVDVAADGGRALEMALSETYDIIFMDCWMPVRSGINVAKELRSVQTGKNARVPIVALTANARKSDEVECLASGMNAFMLKPLMFANLVGMLCRFLPQDGQGTG
jgi:PAS domain S-box-containing protein